MNRRSALLASASIFTLAVTNLALSGCGTVTVASIISQAQTAVTGLAKGFTALTTADPTIIPVSTTTAVTSYFSNATAVLTELSGVAAPAPTATTLQKIFGYINQGLAVLAGPPVNGLIPAPFNEVIAAFDVVAPSIEAFITANLSPSSTPTAAIDASGVKAMAVRQNARATLPAMDYNTAVALLTVYAAK